MLLLALLLTLTFAASVQSLPPEPPYTVTQIGDVLGYGIVYEPCLGQGKHTGLCEYYVPE